MLDFFEDENIKININALGINKRNALWISDEQEGNLADELLHTLGCSQIVGSPRSSSTLPSFGRGR